jgi:hypothetical protein
MQIDMFNDILVPVVGGRGIFTFGRSAPLLGAEDSGHGA